MKSCRFIFSLLAMVVATPAMADPNMPSFIQEYANIPLNPLAVADLNGDGKPDLIGNSIENGPLSPGLVVATNTTTAGSANIQFEPPEIISSSATPIAIFAADINGDGKPDLIVENGSNGFASALAVSIYLNTTPLGATTASFSPPQNVLLVPGIIFAVADVNGDGRPDLIIGNGLDETVSVAMNTTVRGATQSSFAAPVVVANKVFPNSLAIADINGDGRNDIVVVTNQSSVAVLLNNTVSGAAAPNFAPPQSFPVNCGNSNITTTDINGDGTVDIVVGSGCVSGPSYSGVSVLMNTTPPGASSASFSPAQFFPLPYGCTPGNVIAADVNGDGIPDLIATESNFSGFPEAPPGCRGGTYVLVNATQPKASLANFAPYQSLGDNFNLLPDYSDQAVLAADFSGNGKTDLVEANESNLKLFLNTTQSSSVDLDQHGITGSWYNPATSGQGLEIEVYPDAVGAGQGILFAGWFTYDVTATGGRRWYPLQGNVDNANPVATLSIFAEEGGNLNAPPVVNAGGVLGQATIDFSDCTHGLLTYQFTDGSNRSGTIPLTRLTPNVTCAASGDSGAAASDYLLSGNWYDPVTSGQGLMFDFSPSINNLFAAWYTFRPNGQQVGGGASQDWYTLQTNKFTPGMTSFAGIPIAQTTGGVFDNPMSTNTVQVGTADIVLSSCNAMTLSYVFTSGDDAGQHGTMYLLRAGPTPTGCSLQ